MSSVFTKIINREIPSDILFEDEKYIVILDINPIRDGHVLVIPKKETDYIFDLTEEEYVELMSVSKKIAELLTEKLKGKLHFSKVAMIVEGLQVPHVHVHLVPLIDDISLTIEKENKLSLEEVKEILFN
ncbi:hypothetical protein SDC9_07795 [bioreactor metagenome]|uniref:HIT domain-containing protein n=1 Tax=bioreactor metagenome TaxID=1076179 RepID=A0A644T5R7_9ZZZZ|nr:HIT family protein [Candidatus Elulimicrobiales bacterium]